MLLARVFALMALCLVALPAVAAGQGDMAYVSRQDRFALNFPVAPKIEEFTYRSQHGTPWKARRYSAAKDGYEYVMTVVDMSTTTLVPGNDAFRNAGRPGTEKRAAMAHAATNLRKTGKVLLDTYEELQVIPGHKLEIELLDGRMNLVEIHPHQTFLYILEVVSPKDQIPGYDVQSSLELLDAEGMVVRYVDDGYFYPDRPVASRLPHGRDEVPEGGTIPAR